MGERGIFGFLEFWTNGLMAVASLWSQCRLRFGNAQASSALLSLLHDRCLLMESMSASVRQCSSELGIALTLARQVPPFGVNVGFGSAMLKRARHCSHSCTTVHGSWNYGSRERGVSLTEKDGKTEIYGCSGLFTFVFKPSEESGILSVFYYPRFLFFLYFLFFMYLCTLI